MSTKCTHFHDDPDAPGCCGICGDCREAHCTTCAGEREIRDESGGRWTCYACSPSTQLAIYTKADVEALVAIAVAGVRHHLEPRWIPWHHGAGKPPERGRWYWTSKVSRRGKQAFTEEECFFGEPDEAFPDGWNSSWIVLAYWSMPLPDPFRPSSPQNEVANINKADLCSDCPPENWPTDATRCAECPRANAESTKGDQRG